MCMCLRYNAAVLLLVSRRSLKPGAVALKPYHKILATVRLSGYRMNMLIMAGNERESQCTNWFLYLFFIIAILIPRILWCLSPAQNTYSDISYKFSQPSLITSLLFPSLQLISTVSFLLNLAMSESKSVWLTLSQGGIPSSLRSVHVYSH